MSAVYFECHALLNISFYRFMNILSHLMTFSVLTVQNMFFSIAACLYDLFKKVLPQSSNNQSGLHLLFFIYFMLLFDFLKCAVDLKTGSHFYSIVGNTP